MIVTWTGPEVAIFYQALKTHKTDWPKIVIELGGTKSLEELQYVHKRHTVITWTGPEFERFCNAYKKHQTNWPKIVEELEGTKSITDLEYVYEKHHSNIGLITSGNMTVNGLKSALMEDDRMMFINSDSESEGNHLVAQGDAVEVNRDVVADELVQDGGVDVEGVDVEEVNEMVQDGGVQIQAEDGGVQIQVDDVEEVNNEMNEMVQDDVGIQAEDGGGVGAMNAMAHDGGPKPPRRRRLNF